MVEQEVWDCVNRGADCRLPMEEAERMRLITPWLTWAAEAALILVVHVATGVGGAYGEEKNVQPVRQALAELQEHELPVRSG